MFAAMNFELKLGDEASTRYGRACRLVIEAGTRSVKDFVLDNLNPPRAEGLPATLRALRELFDKLRRGSVITLDQFQVWADDICCVIVFSRGAFFNIIVQDVSNKTHNESVGVAALN